MATAIELDEETRRKVERLASRRQEGVDALLREAVCQFLEPEEAQDGPGVQGPRRISRPAGRLGSGMAWRQAA